MDHVTDMLPLLLKWNNLTTWLYFNLWPGLVSLLTCQSLGICYFLLGYVICTPDQIRSGLLSEIVCMAMQPFNFLPSVLCFKFDGLQGHFAPEKVDWIFCISFHFILNFFRQLQRSMTPPDISTTDMIFNSIQNENMMGVWLDNLVKTQYSYLYIKMTSFSNLIIFTSASISNHNQIRK